MLEAKAKRKAKTNKTKRRPKRKTNKFTMFRSALYAIWRETFELWDLVLLGIGNIYYKIR